MAINSLELSKSTRNRPINLCRFYHLNLKATNAALECIIWYNVSLFPYSPTQIMELNTQQLSPAFKTVSIQHADIKVMYLNLSGL